MTSARSRRLLSNGSRFLLAMICLAVLSCRASRDVVDDDVVTPIIIPDTTDGPDTSATTDPAEIDPPVTADTTSIEFDDPDERVRKQIAVLLPFSLDEYNEFMDPAVSPLERSTTIALEFYQGLEFALENMEQDELDVEVHVYDTENDAAKTTRILNSPEFPDVDLIIGPVFNSNLRIASKFCRRENIPMISPLSSSSSITDDNPYYYSANGTSMSHYEALAMHIEKNYPNDTLHIIHSGTDREREVIDAYKEISKDLYEDESNVTIEVLMTTQGNTFNLRDHDFDSLANHVVFIPSYDEFFSTYAMAQLAQLDTYYPSVVFGMPTWINFKNANFDYLEWLEVHITQSYWVNEFNIDVANTVREFSFKYGMEPSQYAYQGYDLAHYVIDLLLKNTGKKRDRDQFFIADKPFQGLQTSFDFIPRYNDADRIDYWDNRHIHMLRFENYMYNKVD